MWNTTCNTTLADLRIDEVPLVGSMKFHTLALIVAGVCGSISILISFYLIFRHATHYHRPWEQRHIIRILFMIPIYSLVSWLSIYFYPHYIYYQVLRDCYEAFAIASFFTLLCNYLHPTLHEQKEYFRQVTPKNWILPINWLQRCTGGESKGPFRKPRSALTLFNILWLCVFQYCFIRVIFTIVSVAAQATDRYCEASLNPVFAHIWVLAFECVSVTIAMYGLIQFYFQLKDDIKEHRPFMKILCIKLVIFFSFWQTQLISLLSSSSGPLNPSIHISYPDIQIGLPALLLCIEMMLFAVLHIFAFPWKIYTTSRSDSVPGAGWTPKEPQYLGGPFGIKALGEAFNPWDMIKATARGFRWLFVGRKKREQDVSYRNTVDGTKMEPLHGAFTPDPNQGDFLPTSFSTSPKPNLGRTTEPTPSRMPYPGDATSDTEYRGATMPQMPKPYHAADEGDLASRRNHAQPGHTYLQPQPYFTRETHGGDSRDSLDTQPQHGDEDEAGLLKNAAHFGLTGTLSNSRTRAEEERYHKRVESGEIMHPAFRRESDMDDAGGPWR